MAGEADGAKGETDLAKILSSMEPVLEPNVYVFLSLPDAKSMGDPALLELEPISTMKEKEGWSAIVTEAKALEKGHPPSEEPMRLISLTVHSALSMCGLTASISRKLADEGISCNVVAGCYHDHLFVDAKRAEDAMAALRSLSSAGA
eukprot:gnl/TRDRNA2_/TRDRNA2_188874_c0_seq1.p1 gnl/TRDRNA2_/TRDRNA2_188874_c0~~gnl/TRDRNA2_/TRDRNA2_188874_c0_seq1.p1  ORF type:complete len:147 (+),score=31.64 gnl/TRDRNA2_/TRDRNA2_188874_c0_seq1:73-513(+)